MTPDAGEGFALMDRLVDCIKKGDVDGMRDVYAPDVVFWHNFDNVEQGLDANLDILRWMVDNVSDIDYEVVRRETLPGGFLQQHILRAVGKKGPIAAPACVVAFPRPGQSSAPTRRWRRATTSSRARSRSSQIREIPAPSPCSQRRVSRSREERRCSAGRRAIPRRRSTTT